MSTKQPNKDADLSIVNRITDLLIAKHISAKELANAIGIHASAISEWKNGKTESYKKSLPQIAEFFHLPISYFYGEELPQNEKAVPDNLIEDVCPDIIVPDVLHQVGIGFHKGEKSLTQDDINDIALIIEMKLNKRNAENEDK